MPPPCWLITPPWGLHGVLHRRQPVAGRAAGGQRIISLPVYGVLWGPALSGRSGYRRARRAVNNWVGEVTRGLIPEVLAETPAPRPSCCWSTPST
ncbi:hypothetical protein M5E87_13990 [Flavonifractor plautii]|nr:hypothetical protein M5E87_13990 [Flavonifractor plautii]